jgi:hypothetical protein
MTKQEQIAELDDGTRTTREIAELVGCSPPYVRAARQRLAGSDVDKRYREKFKQKHGMSRSGWRYRHYPEDRAKRSEYAKHRWANDPEFRERHKDRLRLWRRQYFEKHGESEWQARARRKQNEAAG